MFAYAAVISQSKHWHFAVAFAMIYSLLAYIGFTLIFFHDIIDSTCLCLDFYLQVDSSLIRFVKGKGYSLLMLFSFSRKILFLSVFWLQTIHLKKYDCYRT